MNSSKKFAFVWLFSLSLSACAPPYDRYMEEGRHFQDEKEYQKAKASFHNALLEARKDKKSSDKLLAALEAEVSSAQLLKQSDEALKLLDEAARILEKKRANEQAAQYRKRMGDICAADSQITAAKDFYEQGLSDLGTDQSKSHTGATILIGLAGLRMARNDYKAAAEFMEKACAIMDDIDDADKHGMSQAYNELAFIYQRLNRDDEAAELIVKAQRLEVGGIKERVRKLPKI